MALQIKFSVLWNVTPCRLVNRRPRFGGTVLFFVTVKVYRMYQTSFMICTPDILLE